MSEAAQIAEVGALWIGLIAIAGLGALVAVVAGAWSEWRDRR